MLFTLAGSILDTACLLSALYRIVYRLINLIRFLISGISVLLNMKKVLRFIIILIIHPDIWNSSVVLGNAAFEC